MRNLALSQRSVIGRVVGSLVLISVGLAGCVASAVPMPSLRPASLMKLIRPMGRVLLGESAALPRRWFRL